MDYNFTSPFSSVHRTNMGQSIRCDCGAGPGAVELGQRAIHEPPGLSPRLNQRSYKCQYCGACMRACEMVPLVLAKNSAREQPQLSLSCR